MPIEIPVPVWQQLGVVIIFAMLLAGMAWLGLREFSKVTENISKSYTMQIEKITDNYAKQTESSNTQWQRYFDAKNATMDVYNSEILEKMSDLARDMTNLTTEIGKLAVSQDMHDTMVRTALDEMKDTRARLTEAKKRKEQSAKI